MGDPEPTYDVPLHELHQMACLNLRIGLGFYPFDEVICGHQDEFPFINSLG